MSESSLLKSILHTAVSANVHISDDTPIKVNRHHDTGCLAVTLGDHPASGILFFEDDLAYLNFYRAMQAHFLSENSAIGKML
jgi:hypothetical protein